MGPLTAAVVAAGEGAEGGLVSPYVFGGFTLALLLFLLVVTLLINVDR